MNFRAHAKQSSAGSLGPLTHCCFWSLLQQIPLSPYFSCGSKADGSSELTKGSQVSFRHRMRLRELFDFYSRLSLTVMGNYYWHTHLCCQGYPAAGSAGPNWMEVLLTFAYSQCLHKGTAPCNCSAVPWGYMKYNGPFIIYSSSKGTIIVSHLFSWSKIQPSL